ncbi:hypothetical protein CRG98_001310 [Punica granatum]|uniref:Uncharacterized protein n=1 Tax=Punica granatum TaxID=22663 RepID=A0A2I0LC50_PUNGR|nr:hypothetical protein CRG98_001310 [Punica granatum]
MEEMRAVSVKACDQFMQVALFIGTEKYVHEYFKRKMYLKAYEQPLEPLNGFAVERSKERKKDETETPCEEGRRGCGEDCRGKELERAARGGNWWNLRGAGKAEA